MSTKSKSKSKSLDGEKFVGINPSQSQFGKKSLLYAEMELLTGVKHFQSYKKLRKKEFQAKKLLRKVIKELKEDMKNLELNIPDIPLEEDSLNISKNTKSRDSLEREIENLRHKIEELQ